MTPEVVTDSELVLRVLRAFAFDDCDQVWWRCDGDYAPVTFLVKCSDSFAYASADCEPVTSETIADLERAQGDCEDADGREWGPLLYVARRRRKMPMLSVMRDMPQSIAELFERVER